jgi:hypothetical protein
MEHGSNTERGQGNSIKEFKEFQSVFRLCFIRASRQPVTGASGIGVRPESVSVLLIANHLVIA